MCGNIGMITAVNNDATKKFLFQGLYVDALRGFDSTGLATVDMNGKIAINKKAMAAGDFLNLKAVDDQIEEPMNEVFIGHNRAATRGAINNINAHPFQHEHITMVHNGSLTRFNNLPDYHKFTVDSEAIAYSIASIGEYETLKKLDGAFALVWYDELEEKVKMVRNDKRPLHIANTKDRKTVIWASEKDMLEFLAKRSGLDIEEVWELPTHTIAVFDQKSNDIPNCDMLDAEFLSYNWYGDSHHGARFPHNQGHVSNQEAAKEREEQKKATEEARKTEAERIKDREERSNRMFKEVGINKGEKVRFTPYDFRSFNPEAKDGAGTWEGCTSDEPFITTYIYGTYRQDFEAGTEYVGEALLMTQDKQWPSSVPLLDYRLVIDPKTTQVAPPFLLKEEVFRQEEKKQLALLSNNGGKSEEEGETIEDAEYAEVEMEFLYVTGPRGIAIRSSEFSELTKHGCGVCSRDINLEDADDIEWWGDNKDSPICTTCLNEMYQEQAADYNKGLH